MIQLRHLTQLGHISHLAQVVSPSFSSVSYFPSHNFLHISHMRILLTAYRRSFSLLSSFWAISLFLTLFSILWPSIHFPLFIWTLNSFSLVFLLQFQTLDFSYLNCRIFRPVRRTFFPEKCDLNSTCVLCAEGKYYFQNYKYPFDVILTVHRR